MLMQEDKINVELMKKIITEKKTLASLKNQDKKKVKVEAEKVNYYHISKQAIWSETSQW